MKFTMLFTDFIDVESNPENKISDLYDDELNRLWVGSNGLHYLDPGSWKFKSFVNDPKDTTSLALKANGVIVQIDSAECWCGTWNSNFGLEILDFEASKFYRGRNWDWKNKDWRIQPKFVNSINKDKYGNLWFVSFRGLYFYNHEQNSFSFYIDFPIISLTSSCPDNKGNIWLGSYGGDCINLI